MGHNGTYIQTQRQIYGHRDTKAQINRHRWTVIGSPTCSIGCVREYFKEVPYNIYMETRIDMYR